MIKVLIYIAVVFILSSCSSITTNTDIEVASTIDKQIKPSFKSVGYKNQDQLEKYIAAIQLVEQVLNSDEFERVILEGPHELNYINEKNHEEETQSCNTTQSTYTFNVVDGQCMSNVDILNSIASAEWKLSVRINIRPWAIWCGWPFINEVGHREKGVIVTQKCQFDGMTNERLAGHLIHEYLHVIGFDHPYENSTNRKYTVPYFVGDTASKVLEEGI